MTRRVQRIPETERQTGYCGMTLRRMERAGTFPKRFKLNPNGGTFGAVGHDADEVAAWVEARAKAGKVEAANASKEAKKIHAERQAKAAA